jgi:hypothetical protein
MDRAPESALALVSPTPSEHRDRPDELVDAFSPLSLASGSGIVGSVWE